MHSGTEPREGAWRKKPKPTNLTTKTPPHSPPKKEEKEALPSVSKPAGRGATELVIMNLLLQTSPLGHASALLVFTKFSRAAIHFWPYGDMAQSCSSPLPKQESQIGAAFT